MNSRYRRSAEQGGPTEIVGGHGKPWKTTSASGMEPTRAGRGQLGVAVGAPASHTSHRQQMGTRRMSGAGCRGQDSGSSRDGKVRCRCEPDVR